MEANSRSIGDVIKELLSSYELEGKLKQARVIEAWPTVAGKMITSHTQDLYIRGKKLFVKLDSPALKTELGYSKSQILAALNEAAGGEVISDIVFR